MSPAYEIEEKALRLLHPNWDELSHLDKQARHLTFMHVIDAAATVGIMEYTYNYDKSLDESGD